MFWCVRMRPAVAWLALLGLLLVLVMGSGRASAASFVGTELSDLKPEQKVVVAQPQPVQLLFQFKTKGAPNLQATKQVKADVVSTVKASGLFSEISDEPTANGAVLSIVIDDVVAPGETTDAATKGAITGATLFIAGSTVREHYACSIDYMASPTAPKISRTAAHSIVFQIGLINSTPTDAVKVEGGLKGAVSVMVRQIVSNPLNALASDPGFAGSPAPASVATSALEAPASAPSETTPEPAKPQAPQS